MGFGEELGRAKAVFADLSRAFADMMEKFLADSVLDLSGIREAVNPMVESVLRNPDACVWLAGLRNEDGYAYRHAVSASAWVVAFGRRLGLPAVVLQRLATGGLLFDIGKLRVPKELLEKCERLTPGEFQLLKSHVEFGMEMLKDTGTLNRTVADMIESHHERHGGTVIRTGSKVTIFRYSRALRRSSIAMTRSPVSAPMRRSCHPAMRSRKCMPGAASISRRNWSRNSFRPLACIRRAHWSN